jgi:hypothetical protein
MYADWLEEHDQPRRTNSSVCSARRRAADHDPRRVALDRRARGLLRGRAGAWRSRCHGCPAFAGATSSDFVSSVELRNADAFRAHADRIFTAAPVEELRFDVLTSEAVSVLTDSPHAARLRRLALDSALLTLDDLRALPASPYLTHLRDFDLAALLAGPPAAELLAAWPGLAGVRHLGIGGLRLLDEGVEALTASRHLVNLRSLRLPSVGLGERGVRALARSRLFRSCCGWTRNHNRIGNAGAADLAASASGMLTELNLVINAVGPEGRGSG